VILLISNLCKRGTITVIFIIMEIMIQIGDHHYW